MINKITVDLPDQASLIEELHQRVHLISRIVEQDDQAEIPDWNDGDNLLVSEWLARNGFALTVKDVMRSTEGNSARVSFEADLAVANEILDIKNGLEKGDVSLAVEWYKAHRSRIEKLQREAENQEAPKDSSEVDLLAALHLYELTRIMEGSDDDRFVKGVEYLKKIASSGDISGSDRIVILSFSPNDSNHVVVFGAAARIAIPWARTLYGAFVALPVRKLTVHCIVSVVCKRMPAASTGSALIGNWPNAQCDLEQKMKAVIDSFDKYASFAYYSEEMVSGGVPSSGPMLEKLVRAGIFALASPTCLTNTNVTCPCCDPLCHSWGLQPGMEHPTRLRSHFVCPYTGMIMDQASASPTGHVLSAYCLGLLEKADGSARSGEDKTADSGSSGRPDAAPLSSCASAHLVGPDDRAVLPVIKAAELEAGPNRLGLMCSSGIFEGKFIYVNEYSTGEAFGSDESAKDVSVYFLQDLSHQHNGSGTWIKVRWDRCVELAAGQEITIGGSILKVTGGPASDSVLGEWLSMYNLRRTEPSLANMHPDIQLLVVDLNVELSMLKDNVRVATDNIGHRLYNALLCLKVLKSIKNCGDLLKVYECRDEITASGGIDRSEDIHGDIMESLQGAFQATDEAFIQEAGNRQWSVAAGCVAVAVLIIGSTIFCANTGDSRAVLSRNGKAVELSNDQRPSRQDEFKRIKDAGGFIFFGRVLGRLAVSRAFGDIEYKTGLPDDQSPLVICEPEIHADTLRDEDEFIVLACDGLFDVLSSQEVVDFVRGRFLRMSKGEQDPTTVAQELVQEAIIEKGSRDNVTCVIVMLKKILSKA
ncbi:hypothetical protein FOL47_003083 [Perkinsus chesapeaki]|uniref:PPM-type phosphatase domain-containing protein n=1 Tax=Perkinsus chesapeaki TaxID=330153 RepID=A0A7J6M9Q1_PERCH|nr:hypothetical protein FOL47_003083 [Perkinsus chesapeaki]